MKTKYFDIESVIIYDLNNLSIASNIMLEGYNYDEPVYTNIFCYKKDFEIILQKENDPISKKILFKLRENNANHFQIDIPDVQDNLYSWKLANNYQLEPIRNDEIPFICYNLKL